MKKRILFISLALILALTVLAPAAALARNDSSGHEPASTSFTGSGLIYVTYMPEPVIKGKIWRYQGEIAEGFLDQCDWDLLAGTVFWSSHDSTVRVDDQGNARGIMKGTFSLTRPDGSGALEGSFTGRIQGNLYTGDITDEGTWQSTGGTGVFAGVTATGKWSAELHFAAIPGTDIYTLVGPVAWEGRYVGHTGGPPNTGRPWQNIKPGKPIKPWRPVMP